MKIRQLHLEELYLYCTIQVQAHVKFIGSRILDGNIVYDFKLLRVYWRRDLQPTVEFETVYSYGLLETAVEMQIFDADDIIHKI